MMKPFATIKTFVCLALICVSMSARAQTPLGYETISAAQGLSQGMVYFFIGGCPHPPKANNYF
jgi:hypothetical protein